MRNAITAGKPKAVKKGTGRRTPVLIAFFILYTSIVSFNGIMGYQKNLTTGEGDSSRQIIFGFTFLCLLIYSILSEKKFSRVLSLPLSWIFLLGYCLLSVTWALEPDVSIRRVILLSMITWCVFRCTNSGGYEDMKFVARLVLVLTLVVNYLFVIFIPSIGIHQAKEIMDPSIVGAWKGGVAQKNHAGGICALIMIFFTFDSRSMKKSLKYTVMVAALFFLYKTQSKTSMIMLAVSLMFGYIFRFYDPKYKYFIIPIISIPLCVLTIFLNIHWNTIIDPTFDPYSFTGRGAIWQAVVDWLREDNHWVLGSGFGSFWNIGDKGPIFSHATGWVVSIGNAHDGYLEILSTIGIFGLILALLAAFIIPIGKLLVTSNVPKPKASLCLGLLIFGFGQNFTESTLLDRDQFISVFIVFAVALVREITSPGALPRKLHYRPAKTRPLLAHG